MRSEPPRSAGEHLLGMLSAGTGPFPYRAGVFRLLGMPAAAGVAAPPSLPPVSLPYAGGPGSGGLDASSALAEPPLAFPAGPRLLGAGWPPAAPAHPSAGHAEPRADGGSRSPGDADLAIRGAVRPVDSEARVASASASVQDAPGPISADARVGGAGRLLGMPSALGASVAAQPVLPADSLPYPHAQRPGAAAWPPMEDDSGASADGMRGGEPGIMPSAPHASSSRVDAPRGGEHVHPGSPDLIDIPSAVMQAGRDAARKVGRIGVDGLHPLAGHHDAIGPTLPSGRAVRPAGGDAQRMGAADLDQAPLAGRTHPLPQTRGVDDARSDTRSRSMVPDAPTERDASSGARSGGAARTVSEGRMGSPSPDANPVRLPGGQDADASGAAPRDAHASSLQARNPATRELIAREPVTRELIARESAARAAESGESRPVTKRASAAQSVGMETIERPVQRPPASAGRGVEGGSASPASASRGEIPSMRAPHGDAGATCLATLSSSGGAEAHRPASTAARSNAPADAHHRPASPKASSGTAERVDAAAEPMQAVGLALPGVTDRRMIPRPIDLERAPELGPAATDEENSAHRPAPAFQHRPAQAHRSTPALQHRGTQADPVSRRAGESDAAARDAGMMDAPGPLTEQLRAQAAAHAYQALQAREDERAAAGGALRTNASGRAAGSTLQPRANKRAAGSTLQPRANERAAEPAGALRAVAGRKARRAGSAPTDEPAAAERTSAPPRPAPPAPAPPRVVVVPAPEPARAVPRSFWSSSTLRSAHLRVLR